MEEYEVESIARYEAEQVAEDLERRLGIRMKDLEGRIDNLSDEFYSHCDESLDLREKIAERLEDAARSLQFCHSTEEVIEVLTNLLSELAKIMR